MGIYASATSGGASSWGCTNAMALTPAETVSRPSVSSFPRRNAMPPENSTWTASGQESGRITSAVSSAIFISRSTCPRQVDCSVKNSNFMVATPSPEPQAPLFRSSIFACPRGYVYFSSRQPAITAAAPIISGHNPLCNSTAKIIPAPKAISANPAASRFRIIQNAPCILYAGGVWNVQFIGDCWSE